MDRQRQREVTAIVTGLGLAGIATFLCVSLYTHSPFDLMGYRAGGAGGLENKAGLLGAHLSHHALCLYGTGAWVLALFLLIFGLMMCVRKTTQGFTFRTLGAVLMTLLMSTWAGAMDTHTISDSYPAGPGGLVGGTFIAPLLIGYFGKVGIYIVLSLVGFVACFLLEQKTTEALLAFFGNVVYRMSCRIMNLIIGRRGVQNNYPSGLQPAMAGVSAGRMETAADNDRIPNPPSIP